MEDALTIEMPSASSAGRGPLIEAGQKVLTLIKIEPGYQEGWQDPERFEWTFKVSDPKSPDEYQAFFTEEGEEKTIEWKRGTSRRLGKGKGSKVAVARQWIEALAGRELADSDRINLRELVGKRMLATVIHKPPDAEGNIWADVSRESPPRPFKGGDEAAAAAAGAAAGVAKAAAGGNGARIERVENNQDSDLVAQWERLLKRGEGLQMEGIGKYKATDPSLLSEGELKVKVSELRARVAAAL